MDRIEDLTFSAGGDWFFKGFAALFLFVMGGILSILIWAEDDYGNVSEDTGWLKIALGATVVICIFVAFYNRTLIVSNRKRSVFLGLRLGILPLWRWTWHYDDFRHIDVSAKTTRRRRERHGTTSYETETRYHAILTGPSDKVSIGSSIAPQGARDIAKLVHEYSLLPLSDELSKSIERDVEEPTSDGREDETAPPIANVFLRLFRLVLAGRRPRP
jgi:hypothetical protein